LMLVGDDDTGEIGGSQTLALQTPLSFADGESAIQHDGRACHAGCGRDQKRVSFTAASQTCKFQYLNLLELLIQKRQYPIRGLRRIRTPFGVQH
jgi:hypothetical protein